MATLQNQNANDPNSPNNFPTTGGTSSAGNAQTGAGASGSASGQQPTSPVQQNVAPQAGQGYTDVSAYLNANQSGGNQLGTQVAGNLTNQYNTTQQGIDTSVNNANQSINAGYTPENTQLIQQVASNPTGTAADQNQLNAFQGQLNDTYGGPTSYADYGTQQANVATAQQYGNLLNTPGGNNVLIQDVENQLNPGQTSQGINTLDTLLFSGNPNAVQTAQTAAAPLTSLTDYLNQANTGVTNNIAGAQNAAAQTSQDALNAFTGSNGTLTNLNNTINTNTATDIANAQAQEAALRGDLTSIYGGVTANPNQGYGGTNSPFYTSAAQNYTVGNLSPQDLASLGITQDQWNQLQGSLTQAGTSQIGAGAHNFAAFSPTTQIDLNQFLNQQDPTQVLNNANTATQQQYQETAAINQLLGSQAPVQTEALNPLSASLAGTAPTNLNTFGYQNALTNAQQTAAAEKAAADQETAALVNQADYQHAQSQHGGGLLGGLQQAITHPGNTVASVFNPTSWLPNAINLSKGQGPSPTNINPLAPTTNNALTPIAQKLPQGQLIDKFLNKNGKVK